MNRIYKAAAIIILLMLCMCGVSAEDVYSVSYAVSGHDISETALFAPEDSDNIKSFALESGMFSSEGDVLRRRIMLLDTVRTLKLYMPTDAQISSDASSYSEYDIHGYTEVSFVLDDIKDVYPTLAMGINIDSSFDSIYYIDFELRSEDDTVVSHASLSSDGWNLLYLDISDIQSEEYLLKVRVSYSDNEMPTSISMTPPYITKETPSGFVYAEKYMATEYEVIVGKASMQSGNIRPNDDGEALIYAELVTDKIPATGREALFELRTSGVTGGNLTIGILYKGMREEQRIYYKRISLDAADGIYAIPISVNGEIYSYSMYFTDVECTGFFKIYSVNIYGGGAALITGNPDIGSVDHIKRTDSGVIFSGTMERGAVTRFANSRIRFFAIPGYASDDFDFAVEIGSTNTTTIFEHTLDLSDYPSIEDTYMFFAAIVADDGSIMPFSRPRYCDAKDISPSYLSNMGLYNASAAGVFESNISHVMLDLDLSELIVDKNSSEAILLTYTCIEEGSETKSIALNREILRTLENDIRFYSSSGIMVYIRLICSSPIERLTYDGEQYLNYSVMASDAEARSMYASIVGYISERYTEVEGFAVGMGVNSSQTVGDAEIFEISAYAETLAELCRITYNAASRAAQDTLILVQFDEYGNLESQISDRTLGVALSKRLEEIGEIPWAFVYSIDSVGDELEPPIYLANILKSLEIDGADAIMYFYDPMNDNLRYKYTEHIAYLKNAGGDLNIPGFAAYLAQTFGELCGKCEEYGARAVFMSLGDILSSTDHEFYSRLKNTGFGNSDRYIADYNAVEAEAASLETAVGSYTLWDFSDKHYPLDWISGGGIGSFTTEHSELFSDENERYSRVLRSVINSAGEAGAAGFILRNLKGETDFSGGMKLVFEFAVSKAEALDDEDDLTVVFVVGADDYRAEFNAENVRVGEVQTLVCDLSEYEYASSVGYVGVMVYADNSVNFDLSKVLLYSDTKSSEELSSYFNPVSEESEQSMDWYTLGVFLLIILVVSVSVCVLLLRRDREDAELQRLSERKNGRKSL